MPLKQVLTNAKHMKSDELKFGIYAIVVLIIEAGIGFKYEDKDTLFIGMWIFITTLIFITICLSFYYNDKSNNRISSREIEDKMNKIRGDRK